MFEHLGVKLTVEDEAHRQRCALAAVRQAMDAGDLVAVTGATSFDLWLAETVDGKLPPDQTSFEVTAHEEGVVIGSVRFVGSVVAHETVGTVARTVFARLPDGFLLVEQTATRCTVTAVETEAALLSLLGPGAARLFPYTDGGKGVRT